LSRRSPRRGQPGPSNISHRRGVAVSEKRSRPSLSPWPKGRRVFARCLETGPAYLSRVVRLRQSRRGTAHRPPGAKHAQRHPQPPLLTQPSPSGLMAADRQLESRPDACSPARERTLCADPPTREQSTLRLSPLVVGRRNPARFPEVDVEMDDGKARLRRSARENVLLPAPAMPVTTTRRPTEIAGPTHSAERSLLIPRWSQASRGGERTGVTGLEPATFGLGGRPFSGRGAGSRTCPAPEPPRGRRRRCRRRLAQGLTPSLSSLRGTA
jgi:hypothetical protein